MDEYIWLLSLITEEKCKRVSYGRQIDICNKYTISNNCSETVDKIKDLVVCFNSGLNMSI